MNAVSYLANRIRILFVLLAATAYVPCVHVASAEVRRNAPTPSEASEEAQEMLDAGRDLMRDQDYAAAGKVLAELVEKHPQYGLGWYQLAYCQLVSGLNEEAAANWERSFELGVLRAQSRYNQACAHAIGGRSDAALAALEEAIRLGYDDFNTIQADPDLASLRDLARYDEIVKPTGHMKTAGGTPVEFLSEGGWMVYGHFYEARRGDAKSAPNLLLFHQAGSNYAEYFPIAPRLAELGYNCLSIDARGGGASYGRANATVEGAGARGGGEEAQQDFVAALGHLDEMGYGGDRILWGSSYSAGRLFAVLAESRERVVAGIAFSPGRGFATTPEGEDGSWASKTHVPVFVSFPNWEWDTGARDRFDSIASEDRWLYVGTVGGAHGSSMLRPDRNPTGCEAAWAEVTAFLEKYVPASL